LSYEETDGINELYPPLEGGSNSLANSGRGHALSTQSQLSSEQHFDPSQNLAAQDFTLPQGEGKFIFTGNPVRSEIAALSNTTYHFPDLNPQLKTPDNLGYDVLLASEFYNEKHQKNRPTFNILVLGGSGGAKIFSEVLPKAFFNLRDEIKNNLSITQQCRADYLQFTFDQYQNFNLNILINSFFTDIDEQIKKAHLVIARAGSSSLAEFTCAKKPMILIPFALAADNHQEKNARYLEKSEAAIVIKETDFTINNITNTIEKLIDNPSLLQKMSDNAFKCAHLEASDNLANLIKSLI
jgi:UDP-N-acetylglucosamine--N-acetylmuramyl-(pentapeptide) pyrophosphoryl-undecaprenol N-acetylglucosamine transferase